MAGVSRGGFWGHSLVPCLCGLGVESLGFRPSLRQECRVYFRVLCRQYGNVSFRDFVGIYLMVRGRECLYVMYLLLTKNQKV